MHVGADPGTHVSLLQAAEFVRGQYLLHVLADD